jgi:hypothetical protein
MSAEAQLTPHDGAVSPHQGRTAQGRAAAVPARAIFTRCFSRTRRPARNSQPGAHRAQRRAHVRPAAFTPPITSAACSKPAARSPSATNSKTPARQTRQTRGHADPLARHAFRRTDARGRAEQFPRRRLSVGKIFGLALVDLTTGDFLTTELENGEAALLTELERLRPAEIIFPAKPCARLRDLLRGAFQILNGYDDWTFAPETARVHRARPFQGRLARRLRA